jgi:anti-sigma regulatory factor (Ser/Thr protein kinase)
MLSPVHSALDPPVAGRQVAGWTREALASLCEVPAVHRVGLALTEGGGRRLRFTASDRASEEGVEWCHVDAYDDVPLNTAVRTGRPVLGGLADLDGVYVDFVGRQQGTPTQALAAVPIVAAGNPLGGYVLFFDRQQPFDAAQRAALSRLGEELGRALRQAQRTESRSNVSLSGEEVPPGAVVGHHEVSPDPAAVGEARRFLRSTLSGWGVDDDTTETAALCVSELVTNALIHTHAGCALRVLLDQGVLTTTVRDNGTRGVAPTEPLDDPLRVHGRGLGIVEALATRWGSELDTDGTSVWFVLDL